MKYEYRVRWRREGRDWRREIRQTRRGALRLARRQATAHDELNYPDEWAATRPPPMAEGPIIEKRKVGSWQPDTVRVLGGNTAH